MTEGTAGVRAALSAPLAAALEGYEDHLRTQRDLSAHTVRGYVTDAGPDDPRAREVTLRRLPEQPGMYRGVLTAPGAGEYAFRVAHDPATVHKFDVTEPQREMLEPAMNKPLLEQMAAASNGHFFREETLHTLPDKVSAKVEKKRTTQEAEICYSWFYLTLLLGVATTEWIVRKVSQLK